MKMKSDRQVCRRVDVVTYEFENVPAKTAASLARRKPVLPDPYALETAQDRLKEKNFISALKIATRLSPRSAARRIRRPAARGRLTGRPEDAPPGHDGKGQTRIEKAGDRLRRSGGPPRASIFEAFIGFKCEVSVVGGTRGIARSSASKTSPPTTTTTF